MLLRLRRDVAGRLAGTGGSGKPQRRRNTDNDNHDRGNKTRAGKESGEQDGKHECPDDDERNRGHRGRVPSTRLTKRCKRISLPLDRRIEQRSTGIAHDMVVDANMRSWVRPAPHTPRSDAQSRPAI